MIQMKRVKLPDKPSELIRIALDDLRASVKSGFIVNMDDWCDLTGGLCSVCLAGAVMAKRLLSHDSYGHFNPWDFKGNDKKLLALNYFRLGHVRMGMGLLELQMPSDVRDREIPEYDDDPKAFNRAMRKLARDLEKAGL